MTSQRNQDASAARGEAEAIARRWQKRERSGRWGAVVLGGLGLTSYGFLWIEGVTGWREFTVMAFLAIALYVMNSWACRGMAETFQQAARDSRKGESGEQQYGTAREHDGADGWLISVRIMSSIGLVLTVSATFLSILPPLLAGIIATLLIYAAVRASVWAEAIGLTVLYGFLFVQGVLWVTSAAGIPTGTALAGLGLLFITWFTLSIAALSVASWLVAREDGDARSFVRFWYERARSCSRRAG